MKNKGLTKRIIYAILSKHSRERTEHRGVEQLEARRAHNPEVVGSSPASATKEPPKSKGLGGFFLCFPNFVNGLSNICVFVLEIGCNHQ